MPDGATSDPVLQPFDLKGLTLKNRIMSTSHACGLQDGDHMPSEAYQRYQEEKAKGGLALTMFGGSSYVDTDSVWALGQINMATDAVIPHLRKLAEGVHRHGAATMIQITHLGRRGDNNTQNWLPTLAPSPIREVGHRSLPREIDHADIARIVKAFGDAVWRTQEGGLDGLETMTHGHLIGQFFSPVTNQRSDEFGGSLENRCRFGLMVHEEIRRRVGDDFIVGMRFSFDESSVGGPDMDESIRIIEMFEREGLLDFLNASYGRIDTELSLANECMPGMAMPSAPWLEKAGAFKREMKLPVFHAAKISDISTARYAIREGLLDMVAMTRAHIADPQIVNKIMRGEEDRIRPCVGASYCMGVNRPTCMHNPISGRERHWNHVVEKTNGPIRKVVVVGGGPAGLEAARLAAERGHTVILFEAADQLGGQLRLAERTSWRRDIIGIVDWRASELERLGVDVHLNAYVEATEITSLQPDMVILATGGLPHTDWLEGNELVTSAWDALSGNAPLGDSVLVYDGTGRYGAACVADKAASEGKSVSFVMIDDTLAKELQYAECVIWRKRFAEHGISAHAEYGPPVVERAGNKLAATFISDLTGESLTLEADTVVVETGTLPSDEMFNDLSAQSVNDGQLDHDAFVNGASQPILEQDGMAVFRIGDALASRDVPAAMYDALRLCGRL